MGGGSAGVTTTQFVLLASLSFLLVALIVAIIAVLVLGDTAGDDTDPNVAGPGGGSLEDNRLTLPSYAGVIPLSACEWDDTHDVCVSYDQALSSLQRENNGDINTFMGRSLRQAGIFGFGQWAWDNFILRFIGSSTFVITTEHDPCTPQAGDTSHCVQMYLMDAGGGNFWTFFDVPPHDQIFNRFQLVRREDSPYFNEVNLRVIPHPLCDKELCNQVRDSVDPYFFTTAGMTLDKDDPSAIWKWTWDVETSAPAYTGEGPW